MSRSKLTALVASALVASCYWIAEFPDESPANDADGDADTDGDTDTDADAGADADAEPGPWPCDQPSATRPQLRLTAFGITAPAALADGLVQSVVNAALDDLRMVWLLEVDLLGSELTTGSGRGVAVPPRTDAELCRARWDDAELSPVADHGATIEGDLVSTSTPIPFLRVPIRDAELAATLALPLRRVELEGLRLSSDRTLVGSPSGTFEGGYSSSWETAGELRAWIAVEDSRVVVVGEFGVTLCGLLSGDIGTPGDPGDDCSSGQATWPNPPGEIPESGGEPGYELVAEIGAGAVTIE